MGGFHIRCRLVARIRICETCLPASDLLEVALGCGLLLCKACGHEDLSKSEAADLALEPDLVGSTAGSNTHEMFY